MKRLPPTICQYGTCGWFAADGLYCPRHAEELRAAHHTQSKTCPVCQGVVCTARRPAPQPVVPSQAEAHGAPGKEAPGGIEQDEALVRVAGAAGAPAPALSPRLTAGDAA